MMTIKIKTAYSKLVYNNMQKLQLVPIAQHSHVIQFEPKRNIPELLVKF